LETLDRGRPVVTASRSRPFQVAGDDRDQGLVCKCDQLILKPCELETAGDGRAECGLPWSRDHGDSSLPRSRMSPGLGCEPRRGCHPCPYFGRSCALV